MENEIFDLNAMNVKEVEEIIKKEKSLESLAQVCLICDEKHHTESMSKLKDSLSCLFSNNLSDLIKESYKANKNEKLIDEKIIMGEGDDFVGIDENSFSKIQSKSFTEKISSVKSDKVITEEHMKSRLNGIDYIRSVAPLKISFSIPEISIVKMSDLVELEKGQYMISSSKIDRDNEFQGIIVLESEGNRKSFLKLDEKLRLSLSSSSEFSQFVKLGVIIICSEDDKNEILKKCESVEKSEKYEFNGINIEKVLEYSEEYLRKICMFEEYENKINDFQSLTCREITSSEKLRISSEILTRLQKEAFEKVGKR